MTKSLENLNSLHVDRPVLHGEKRLAVGHAYRAVAGGGANKRAPVAFESRLEGERFGHSVVHLAGHALQQAVAGEGSAVPVAALEFVERVAHAAVVAAS